MCQPLKPIKAKATIRLQGSIGEYHSEELKIAQVKIKFKSRLKNMSVESIFNRLQVRGGQYSLLLDLGKYE